MVQVWVDGGTASAAEVLAGALRDLCPPGARLAGARPLTRLSRLDERRTSTHGLGLSEMDMHMHAYPQWTRCVLVRRAHLRQG